MTRSIGLSLLCLAATVAGCVPEVTTDDDGTVSEETSDGCHELLCRCSVQLINVVEGHAYDLALINSGLGPNDPHQMFASGGSLNQNPVCRAAKFRVDHDPTWFNAYFDAQREPGVGFMGTEILSGLYGPPVVSAVLATLAHARTRGLAATVARAEEWLRVYWALNALAARPGPIVHATYVLETQTLEADGNEGWTDGVSVASAGSRARDNGEGGAAEDPSTLLTVALAHQPRRFTGAIDAPLRVTFDVAGYHITANGKIDLESMVPPSAAFGLTDEERADLDAFVANRGAADRLAPVLALVGDAHPACDLTFLNTSTGVVSWFGTDSTAQRFCNLNKGPYAGVRFDDDAHATYLHPTFSKSHTEPGASFRAGNQICARLDAGIERCIDMPSGQTLFELRFTNAHGAELVAGGGNTPPPQTGGTDGAQVLAPTVPATVSAGKTFSASVTVHNTGSSTWTHAAAYRLGSAGPMDNLIWSEGRADLPPDASIAPGQSYTFELSLRAPSQPGRYNFQWGMLREGVAWFGNPSPAVTVDVTQ